MSRPSFQAAVRALLIANPEADNDFLFRALKNEFPNENPRWMRKNICHARVMLKKRRAFRIECGTAATSLFPLYYQDELVGYVLPEHASRMRSVLDRVRPSR